MRQDFNEIPARREGHREPQDEGNEDFQAHLFSVTPNSQHSPNINPVQPAGLVIRFKKSRQRT
jgi:hypothetical protein